MAKDNSRRRRKTGAAPLALLIAEIPASAATIGSIKSGFEQAGVPGALVNVAQNLVGVNVGVDGTFKGFDLKDAKAGKLAVGGIAVYAGVKGLDMIFGNKANKFLLKLSKGKVGL